MSNTTDLINLFYDLLSPLGILIEKFNLSVLTGERMTVNAIPNINQTRWGANKMNRFLVNVNVFIPKLSDGRVNSARIAVVENLILTQLEKYRIGFKQKYTITLTGTGGTANVSVCGGLTKLVTFTSTLTLTAVAFVASWASAYLAVGVTVTSLGATIIFESITEGVTIASPVITNVSTNLAGTVVQTQAAATTRVRYYSLDPQPATVFNESDKENLLNIRVETAIT